MPSHFLGLLEAHQIEQSRCHVTEHAILLLEREACGSICHHERHFVRGVRCLGCLLLRKHLLGVSVLDLAYGHRIDIDTVSSLTRDQM